MIELKNAEYPLFGVGTTLVFMSTSHTIVAYSRSWEYMYQWMPLGDIRYLALYVILVFK